MINLDNNATTQPAPEAIEAVMRSLGDNWHNPSATHRAGQAARAMVELARQEIARLIGAMPREIIFTSGGTESISLAIRGVLGAWRIRRAGATSPPVVVTTAIEHDAVRELLAHLEREGAIETVHAGLEAGGIIDVGALDRLLIERADGVALLSVQWVNNETGAVQPMDEIVRVCRERKVVVHCDGAQRVGRAPVDVRRVPVDLLSFAAHKFHGVKGAGALYVRTGMALSPVVPGAQELGRRGGTEAVPAIVGMGAAATAAMDWLRDPRGIERMRLLRDGFERRVVEQIPGSVALRPENDSDRLWTTSNIAFPRLEAEPLLMLMSERGLCASAGAACSSGSLEPSETLLAMGVDPKLAHGAIRFSLSRETTGKELDDAVEIVRACVERLRGSSARAL